MNLYFCVSTDSFLSICGRALEDDPFYCNECRGVTAFTSRPKRGSGKQCFKEILRDICYSGSLKLIKEILEKFKPNTNVIHSILYELEMITLYNACSTRIIKHDIEKSFNV